MVFTAIFFVKLFDINMTLHSFTLNIEVQHVGNVFCHSVGGCYMIFCVCLIMLNLDACSFSFLYLDDFKHVAVLVRFGSKQR